MKTKNGSKNKYYDFLVKRVFVLRLKCEASLLARWQPEYLGSIAGIYRYLSRLISICVCVFAGICIPRLGTGGSMHWHWPHQ